VKNPNRSVVITVVAVVVVIIVAGRQVLFLMLINFISYYVLDTSLKTIFMSALFHFYRARSATAINQLKPLQQIRSRSPDDVLHRQKVKHIEIDFFKANSIETMYCN